MTMSKKVLSILMAIVMVFSISVISVSAQETVDGLFYEEGEYKLHYTVVPAEGEFKGRIMFLHGFLYSGTTWNGMADVMSKQGYDCYLLDLPGFGYSTRETVDTELIARETLVVNFMETVAPTSEWILAGHSMGGGVAMNIACENELEALMLYCPSEVYMQNNSMMSSLAGSAFLGKIMDSLFGTLLKIDFIVKAAVYMTTGDMEYAKNYDASLLADPLMIPGTGTGMLLASVNAKNTDLEAIAKIETPTLLVWANGDNVIGADMVTNISGALANADVKKVEGSHIVIETNPEELAGLSLEFLAK